MRTSVRWAIFTVAFLFVISACSAGAAKPTVSGAWVRVPMGADRPAAGYLTIVGGDKADALIAASSPVSMDVQVHETTETADGMGMQEVDRIEIPAGATVQLEPGGYHIMIMMPDLEQVVVGESVEITLTFEGAGDIVVDAEVRAG